MWEEEQDMKMIETMRKRREKKEEKGPKEVLTLSGTDSDSDLELPIIKKLRKKQKEKDGLNHFLILLLLPHVHLSPYTPSSPITPPSHHH